MGAAGDADHQLDVAAGPRRVGRGAHRTRDVRF
jgi:hypothetical protein